MESKFLVGYGDVVITPEWPVPLGGCSFDTSTRFNTNVFEDIHAIATAMTDEEGSSLLYVTFDTVRAYNHIIAEVRPRLSEKLGIPQASRPGLCAIAPGRRAGAPPVWKLTRSFPVQACRHRRQPASSLPRSGHWAPNLGPKYCPELTKQHLRYQRYERRGYLGFCYCCSSFTKGGACTTRRVFTL